jgi:uncharacterized protein YjiS (DUF1127 family)
MEGNAMTNMTLTRGVAAPRRPAALPTFAARIAAAVAVWRQRRALSELPDHLREDVGLSAEEIRREANRPLWDVPRHWIA